MVIRAKNKYQGRNNVDEHCNEKRGVVAVAETITVQSEARSVKKYKRKMQHTNKDHEKEIKLTEEINYSNSSSKQNKETGEF